MDKNKLKAIIFDWGGVCCAEGEPFASVPLQKRLGLTPDEIAAAVRPTYTDYYRGQHNRESFWGAVLNHWQLPEDEDLNPRALSAAYLNSYRIYPEILAAAERLRQNYQVALLSNLTPEMRDHIRATHNTDRYFDPEVYSCDADVMSLKPDPTAYLATLAKLNRQPEECLFIDNTAKNLVGAEALGIQTLLFENPAQCLSDLADLLK